MSGSQRNCGGPSPHEVAARAEMDAWERAFTRNLTPPALEEELAQRQYEESVERGDVGDTTDLT